MKGPIRSVLAGWLVGAYASLFGSLLAKLSYDLLTTAHTDGLAVEAIEEIVGWCCGSLIGAVVASHMTNWAHPAVPIFVSILVTVCCRSSLWPGQAWPSPVC